MLQIDWKDCLERLLKETRLAVEQFAAEHPDEEVCFFAYDSEPEYGYALACFNTTAAARDYVRERQQYALKNCSAKMLAAKEEQSSAYSFVKQYSVLPYCDNTGDFAYQGYTEISFPEWESFFQQESYPVQQRYEDDYLESRVAALFSRALHQLADEGAFSRLKLAAPALLGFGFHDQDPVIVRLLNIEPQV